MLDVEDSLLMHPPFLSFMPAVSGVGALVEDELLEGANELMLNMALIWLLSQTY